MIGWLVLLLLLGGCTNKAITPPVMVTSQAPVESVQVSIVEGGSTAAQVLVHGQLPDGCTRLGDPVISSGEGLVVIILPAYRSSAEQNCAGPQAYDRVIPLASGLAPGRYTVSVNGVQAVFELGGLTPATLPTQAPTAAPLDPTPPPVEEQPAPAVPTPANPPAENADCVVKGAFFSDLTVPDGTVFLPGEKFTKSWRIRNAGTCVWQGYALVFQRGDQMGSPVNQPVVGKVEPGETVDLSINFTAPQAPGAYFSDWLLSTADGQLFGLGNPPIGLLWLKIGVRSPPAVVPPPAEPLPPAAGQPDQLCAYVGDPGYEAQLLVLINAARSEKGLTPFKLIDSLSSAARLHSADMACHDFVEHYGYDGSTWNARIKAQGVPFRSASENIYAGNPDFGGTPEGSFNWWMNSQIHRENILNPQSTQIGIGYVFFAGSTYKGYYTLNFVQP